MDDEGFREFVRTRLARLGRVAYLLTGDHHAAEDLLQNALVRVGVRWRQVAAARDPDAYVHVSSWRRRSRVTEQLRPQPPDRPGGRDEADDAVRRMLLRQALRRLTPRQRAVIVLRYFEDLPEADIADAMSCSVGTVKSQLHHALARLRALAPELADLIQEPAEVTTWKA
jgi:RNA polymerase sigma-70 factor (sigma-E family)